MNGAGDSCVAATEEKEGSRTAGVVGDPPGLLDVSCSAAATSEDEVTGGGSVSGSLDTPKTSLFNLLDKLFELTAAGYVQTVGSNEFLESVSTVLMSICEAVVELDLSDQMKWADDMGDRPQFMAALVPFMAQVYYGG